MSLVLRRWRHKLSPAARRGRVAAREHTARMEQQQALKQGGVETGAARKP
jgi:hypothetical protein